MMTILPRVTPLLLLSALLAVNVWAEFTASEEDTILREILKTLHTPKTVKRQQLFGSKFNNCPKDEPFPCKSTNKCISLKHVCDGNFDCPEQWDEDKEVCIAYQRVPAEDMLKFVRQQAHWLVPAFFGSIVKGPDDLRRIASALSTSANIDVFQQKLKLDRASARKFELALNAVRGSDLATLEGFGMSPDSWTEVKMVFKNLVDSGLLPYHMNK